MQLKVIAYAHNGHTDKFGIPRQSRDESPILTRIVFEPEFAVKEALRGIEGFSHLWLIWGFNTTEWSPTVRPPRLGGNKRMGVFATRSPFRPNPIGLSSVKLVEVRRVQNTDRDADRGQTQKYQLELIVSGADVLDGTPIYDIKPYLSFSDSHEDAKNGFAEETKDYRLDVEWGEVSLISAESPTNHPLITHLSPTQRSDFGRVKDDLEFILSQDPRPAYQDDPTREYKLDYGGYTVTFVVHQNSEKGNTQNGVVIVKKIEKM